MRKGREAERRPHGLRDVVTRSVFIGLAVALAAGLIVPIAIFGRIAMTSVEVDLSAQAAAERARTASTAAKLVEDLLSDMLLEVGLVASQPPFAGPWYFRDPAPVEIAIADLIRRGRYRHAAVYGPSVEVPIAAAALGEAGSVNVASRRPSIRHAIGPFEDGDGEARALAVFRDEVVRRGLGQQIVYSSAFPLPRPDAAPGAFIGAPAAVFIARSVPPASNGSIVVAPRLEEVDAILKLFAGPGRTARVLARDAGDHDRLVTLSGTDPGSKASLPNLPGIDGAFEGARTGAGRGAPPGKPGHALVSDSSGERLIAYAPIHGGAWVVVIADDPAVTLGAQRALADQLREGSQVAVLIAAALALAFALLLGLIERQRRALVASLAENVRLLGAVRAASQAKSRFLASMSHELRTPLNSIIGFSQVLGQRLYGELNEKQREYVSDIEGSGQHLLRLINEVLDLSKVEAGRMEFYPQEFSPAELVRETVAAVRPLAEARQVALVVDLQGGPEVVHHDPGRLRQVLLNLVSNALKFTREGGTVTTRLVSARDGFELSVQDTGIGIGEADLGSIFEEFRQIESDHGRTQQGTGLGLALVKRYVDLMGGRIVVTSTVGVGSLFTVRLPLRHPAAVSATTA